MKKYFKFTIVSAALLSLPYCAAFTADLFGTGMASFPALIFFAVSSILALIRIIKKKQIRYNLIVMGCGLCLILSIGIPLTISNRGLHELTEKRMQILKELRPVFLKYNVENGEYPVSLNDLAPEYVLEIPRELVNDGKADPYKKIAYSFDRAGQPVFHFHTIRGPDSTAIYNIEKDTLWHDQ